MPIVLGIRPVNIDVGVPNDKLFEAKIDVSEMMGSEMHLHINASGKDVIGIIQTAGLNLDTVRNGIEISFEFDPSLAHLFNRETEENLL